MPRAPRRSAPSPVSISCRCTRMPSAAILGDVAVDRQRKFRQVAIVDAVGAVAVTTRPAVPVPRVLREAVRERDERVRTRGCSRPRRMTRAARIGGQCSLTRGSRRCRTKRRHACRARRAGSRGSRPGAACRATRTSSARSGPARAGCRRSAVPSGCRPPTARRARRASRSRGSGTRQRLAREPRLDASSRAASPAGARPARAAAGSRLRAPASGHGQAAQSPSAKMSGSRVVASVVPTTSWCARLTSRPSRSASHAGALMPAAQTTRSAWKHRAARRVHAVGVDSP